MAVFKDQIKQACDAGHCISISFKRQFIIFFLHIFKNSFFVTFSLLYDQNNLHVSLIHWPDNEIIICESTQYFILIVHSLIHSIEPFYHFLIRRENSEESGQWGQFIYSFNKYFLVTYYVVGTLLKTGKTHKGPCPQWSIYSKEERQAINRDVKCMVYRRVKGAVEKIEKGKWSFVKRCV